MQDRYCHMIYSMTACCDTLNVNACIRKKTTCTHTMRQGGDSSGSSSSSSSSSGSSGSSTHLLLEALVVLLEQLWVLLHVAE